MGTNFYLAKTKGEGVDWDTAVHIAKTSYGWYPLFQAHPELGITSVKDIKDYYLESDCLIFDEYEAPYTWKSFEVRVLSWGQRMEKQFPDGVHSHIDGDLYCYRDPEGYEFFPRDFC